MNRLVDATSPYLRQHAGNPVHWRPWGDEALEEARRSGKPIFLSIGYSACHWCHVMAHESFEDHATADILNRDFIPIKVDREERPDLDRIYQSAHQALTRQSGGWPLSIFLTPGLHPFFSGTYFPREPRPHHPAFREILAAVHLAYAQRREDVEHHARQVVQFLERFNDSAPATTRGGVEEYAARLLTHLDGEHGGFGSAPKFPHVTDLRLLLRHAFRSGMHPAAQAVAFTLDHMIAGGIMDQVGGGFARYSVDAAWEVPHFEKMLYDNGALLHLLSETDALLGVDQERQRARCGIVAWMQRRMLLPSGALAASTDADADGQEGAYYVWSWEELTRLLAPGDLALVQQVWGATPQGNFEGSNLLLRRMSDAQVQQRLGESALAHLQRVRAMLLDARMGRMPLGRDDKVLLGWNALAFKGLLSHATLEQDDAVRSMVLAGLEFLVQSMRDGRGWYAVWRDGHRHTRAFLDDHALILDLLLDAASVFGPERWLELARITADEMLARFADPGGGGFFFTPREQEDVILRTRSCFDADLPSGNGVALSALTRLGLLTGDDRYTGMARQAAQSLRGWVEQGAGGHGQLALALDLLEHGPALITLSGPTPSPFVRGCGQVYLPDAVIRHGAPQDVPGATLCHAGVCLPAIHDPEGWRDCLRAQSPFPDPGVLRQ
ncbi:MAG: thioredoxin domain-containing protein [Magnetococcus sp. WYHC-3]